MTIHQPSSQMFYLFDVVVFMKDGRIFYHGSPKEILPFYAKKGYLCPDNYNPSDFVMEICQAESGQHLEEKGLFMDIPNHLLETFASSEQGGGGTTATSSSTKMHEEDLTFHFESSFTKQVTKLTQREFLNITRDFHTLGVKFGLTVVMGILYGLIFYQIGGSNYGNIDDFNSHFGALVMVMIFSLMGAAQSVLLTFPFERPMILREYVTGTCTLRTLFSYHFFSSFLSLCLFFCLVSFSVNELTLYRWNSRIFHL